VSALRELQLEFAQAVFDERSASAFSRRIRQQGLNGERRLRIYRNNFTINLSEALSAVFLVTQRLVGEDFFRQTARGYVRAVRSTSGDIHHYGDAFPAYLDRLPALADYPYLGDVARLEWVYHSVFHTALAAPLDLARLAGVAADDYPALCFRLQPAARLIASDYPVLRIWQVNLDHWTGERDVRLDAGPAQLLVMRTQDAVTLEPLNAGEHRLLEQLIRGQTLADAGDAAFAADAAFDLAAALRRFVAGGVLVDFGIGRSFTSTQQRSSTSEV